jgi:hypothetical protein
VSANPSIATQGAGIAVVGGLVNLACDGLFISGAGRGDAVGTPHAVASYLAATSLERAAAASVIGALAIGTWTLATPALLRLIRPAGPRLENTVALLHTWFISQCIALHVAFGALAWLGHLAHRDDGSLPTVLAPLWTTLQVATGLTMLALAAALAAAVWRGRPSVPIALPFVSPLIAFSVLALPARLLPAPFGAGIALMASTAGGIGWLATLWVCSRAADRREGAS